MKSDALERYDNLMTLRKPGGGVSRAIEMARQHLVESLLEIEAPISKETATILFLQGAHVEEVRLHNGRTYKLIRLDNEAFILEQ